jgi:hypothetical protein
MIIDAKIPQRNMTLEKCRSLNFHMYMRSDEAAIEEMSINRTPNKYF